MAHSSYLNFMEREYPFTNPQPPPIVITTWRFQSDKQIIRLTPIVILRKKLPIIYLWLNYSALLAQNYIL